jgi:hypothetical protein
MFRDKEKRVDPWTIEELMPGFEFPEEEPDEIELGEQAFRKAKLFLALLGGEDKTAGMNIQIMKRG